MASFPQLSPRSSWTGGTTEQANPTSYAGTAVGNEKRQESRRRCRCRNRCRCDSRRAAQSIDHDADKHDRRRFVLCRTIDSMFSHCCSRPHRDDVQRCHHVGHYVAQPDHGREKSNLAGKEEELNIEKTARRRHCKLIHRRHRHRRPRPKIITKIILNISLLSSLSHSQGRHRVANIIVDRPFSSANLARDGVHRSRTIQEQERGPFRQGFVAAQVPLEAFVPITVTLAVIAVVAANNVLSQHISVSGPRPAVFRFAAILSPSR